MVEFELFTKIPRLSRECVITEKIDGTNGQVFIEPVSFPIWEGRENFLATYGIICKDHVLLAGSRNRWLSPREDNYGFWKWVNANAPSLVEQLGIGRHFGEWWGVGIGRGYDVFSRQFTLFNTKRWTEPFETGKLTVCSVVPVMYEGVFTTLAVDGALASLSAAGSRIAPGFTKPEGVVVYHKAANVMFKKTLEKDEQPKGKQ